MICVTECTAHTKDLGQLSREELSSLLTVTESEVGTDDRKPKVQFKMFLSC